MHGSLKKRGMKEEKNQAPHWGTLWWELIAGLKSALSKMVTFILFTLISNLQPNILSTEKKIILAYMNA